MKEIIKIKNRWFNPIPFTKKGVNLQSKRGFMTIEILVAVSIIVVSILAAMSVTQKSVYISRQSLHLSQASFLLEEGAEIIRILRDNSWDNISNLTIGADYYPTFSENWSLSISPSTLDIFTRKITVANVNRDISSGDISSLGENDLGTKLITITVTWVEGGETINKILSFYIMDIFS